MVLTPGQAGENPQLLEVLRSADVDVHVLLADKAYSHPSTRTALEAMGITAVIPERSDQIERRHQAGDLAEFLPGFDPDIYKLRNVVERFFGRIKEFRAVATRYDKLAITFLAGITLAGIITWLRDI